MAQPMRAQAPLRESTRRRRAGYVEECSAPPPIRRAVDPPQARPTRAGPLREGGLRPQSTDSTHSASLVLGSAPILVAATCPFLNRISVGMPRTPYFIGVCGFSSILILAMVTLPFMSVANFS